MAQINILDSSVFNLISAGEVVERPSSVVKELVENAIDAGATKITVEIKDGGIRQIIVSDNGCGMDAENLKKACLPHATSKLKEAQDLDCIATLGFRGEALASISAISQVTIKTKTEDKEIGNSIKVYGGKAGDVEQCGVNQGTVIIVDNIFYNTPVRAKFLKKPKVEEGFVTQIITSLILSNPEISFRYIVDGKTVFNTVGGLEDAVYQVYSNEIANNMIYFDQSFNDGYRVYGFTGKRQLSRHNRNYQTIIINGRIIQNQSIATAVMQAYGNSMMKRCFPVFVINIIMPFDDVDVNVHPSKSEVRFRDNNKIFSVVYRAITLALAKEESSICFNEINAKEETIVQSQDYKKDIKDDNDIQDNVEAKENVVVLNNEIDSKEVIENNKNYAVAESENSKFKSTCKTTDCNIASIENNAQNTTKCGINNQSIIKSALNNNSKQQGSYNFSSGADNFDKKHDEVFAQEKLNKAIKKQEEKIKEQSNIYATQTKTDVHSVSQKSIYIQPSIYDNGDIFNEIDNSLKNDFEIIGQIFNTYLIIQKQGIVYFIDQHAAHERYLYDALIEKFNNRQCLSQPMLVPFVLDCDNAQYEFVLKCKENLQALGFELEEFGGLSWKVNAVPDVISQMNLTAFFAKIFEEKAKIIGLKNSDLISDSLAQWACKSAIKGGDKLSNEQIQNLLEQMSNDIPVQCPHGRPAILSFTKKDFDKMFKRIV